MFKKFQLIKMFALIFEGYELNIVSQILGLRIILFNLLFLQRHCFEILQILTPASIAQQKNIQLG